MLPSKRLRYAAQLAGKEAASPLLIDVHQYLAQTDAPPVPAPEEGTLPPSKMRVTATDAPLSKAPTLDVRDNCRKLRPPLRCDRLHQACLHLLGSPPVVVMSFSCT